MHPLWATTSPMSHHISYMSHHISCELHHISYEPPHLLYEPPHLQWATISPMSHHISYEPPHLLWATTSPIWATISPLSHHISTSVHFCEFEKVCKIVGSSEYSNYVIRQERARQVCALSGNNEGRLGSLCNIAKNRYSIYVLSQRILERL